MPTIEVNGTFYRTQTPATFAKWASETPDGFVFALKGPRYAVNRRVLAEAGDSSSASSIPAAGARRQAGADALAVRADEEIRRGRLRRLPRAAAAQGRAAQLRHVVEVRHDSFCTPEFIKLAREHNVPIVFAEHATYPAIADVTGDFIYARLQKGRTRSRPATRRRRSTPGPSACRRGPRAACRPTCKLIDEKHKPAKQPRDAFVYFIHEGKVRAPHAAMALMERVRK